MLVIVGTWFGVMQNALRYPYLAVLVVLITLGFLVLILANLNYDFGTSSNFRSMFESNGRGICGHGYCFDSRIYLCLTSGSETARRLLTAEMVVDIAFVLVAGTVYLSLLQGNRQDDVDNYSSMMLRANVSRVKRYSKRN